MHIFTQSALEEAHLLSGGVPRAINNICDLALLTGFINRVHTIDEDIIIQVAQDLEDNLPQAVTEGRDD